MKFALILLVLLKPELSNALWIDGCPLFGCRPSGSFSFYLQVPRDNASINWVSDFVLDPVPNPLGCVADHVNIVCQSNGPFSEEKGYISIYGENGTIRWRDKVLTFPTLPMLDNYGDVTGSDGVNLVHYDQDGKQYPIIKCYGLKPMFSMQFVSPFYLLLVGEQGGLVVRDTNAIPVAEIFLNDSIQRTNGTFLPISQPVVKDSRFYLLTEFVPESDVYDPTILNLQRLYAIDIHDRPANIMTIAWFYNFEMERSHADDRIDQLQENIHKEKQFVKRKDVISNILQNINSKQNVIWDGSRQSVYVALPPPYMSENSINTFWGFKDNGDDLQINFRSDLDVTHMATFEADDDADDVNNQAKDTSVPLWVSTADSLLQAIQVDGNVSQTININALFKTKLTMTTKLALVRENNTAQYALVFGFKTLMDTDEFKKMKYDNLIRSDATSFVAAVETTTSPNGRVLWMVPVPNNMEVKGQITGSRGAEFQRKDQLIFYAEETGKSAKIISIH